MKNRIVMFFFFLVATSGFAQPRVAVGYNYLAAGNWDRAIQTYNFARPELTNKQPLFIHGIELGADYLWINDKPMKHGMSVSYRYFRSAAANDNFDVVLNAHLVNIGYVVHNSVAARRKGFSVDVGVYAILGGIYRNVNGEPLRDDDTRIWAPGIGGELRPRVGYTIAEKEKYSITPFVQASYCPIYFSPRAEALLNQTMTLTGVKYTSIVNLEAGVCISFVRSE
jgi:hypothetical protein